MGANLDNYLSKRWRVPVAVGTLVAYVVYDLVRVGRVCMQGFNKPGRCPSLYDNEWTVTFEVSSCSGPGGGVLMTLNESDFRCGTAVVPTREQLVEFLANPVTTRESLSIIREELTSCPTGKGG